MLRKVRKQNLRIKSVIFLIIAMLMASSACNRAGTAEIKARQDFVELLNRNQSFKKVPGFGISYRTEGSDAATLVVSIVNMAGTAPEPLYLSSLDERSAIILKFTRVRVSHANGREEIINL
jgi:hypothetical protein